MTTHTYSFGKRNGNSIVRAIEFDELPTNVLARATVLGVGNMVRDSIAGLNKSDFKTDDDWAVEAEKILDAKIVELKAGVLRSFAERTTDPVKRAARAIAVDLVRTKFKKDGKKPEDHKEAFAAAIAKVMELPQVAKLAQERVDRESALDDIQI